MNLAEGYRRLLERTYERANWQASGTAFFYWLLLATPFILPAVIFPQSRAASVVAAVAGAIAMIGYLHSAWTLWGISIEQANARAQRLEDEEWNRFN